MNLTLQIALTAGLSLLLAPAIGLTGSLLLTASSLTIYSISNLGQ